MSKTIFGCLNIALCLRFELLALTVCLPVTAQELTPEQTRCLNRGKTFAFDEQISGCTTVLQSDRVSDGNRAVAYVNRGIAYAGKKDYDRAIADFNEAIRINPNYAVAYSNRGNLFEARGRRNEAIADFRRALAIDPNHQPSRDALKRLGAAP